MALAGNGGATGVAAAGSTATTAGVGDDATASRGVSAAVTAGADPVPDALPDTDDRAAGSNPGSITEWISASAATTACCTACVIAFPPDGVGSGELAPADGVELVGAMTSSDEVEGALVGPGVKDSDVEDSGVLPWPAETVGDVLVDSAAAVSLGVPLLVDWVGAVPALLGDDELWVVFLVRNDVVDDAVSDPPDFCVEGDGPIDVPSEEVLGAGLASEPVVLLDE
jgi:hypothetical protein